MTKRYGNRFHGCRVNEYGWRNQQLIVIENQLLRIGVLATKGADIIEFRYKPSDLDVLWHAPQSLLSGEYVPTVSRPQGAFLDYYIGGWQEVFPNAGAGRTIEGAVLGQHGEVALLPWDVEVLCDSAERVEVEFAVETVRTPFRLSRTMILEANSAVLHMHERVTNLGTGALPFGWGHHPCFGSPFLQEGCIVEMPPCTMDGGPYATQTVPAISAGLHDVVVCTDLSDGWCTVRNPALNLSVRLAWDRKIFPYCWMWRVYGGCHGYPYYGRTYNLGVEPFNCPLEGGTGATLRPGESIETDLSCGIVDTNRGS